MATVAEKITELIAQENIASIGGARPRIGRDFAGDNARFPYITYSDSITNVPELMGDGQTMARRRRQQWDVWQKYREEDDFLVGQLIELLDGAKLVGPFSDAPGAKSTMRMRVIDSHRVFDPGNDVVHTWIDVWVTYLAAGA